jgi:hypothetical protein
MSRAGGGINAGLISSIRSGNGGGGGSSGRLFGAGPSIAKDDVKGGLDRIFGKLTLGDSVSRNQGMSKLMGAAPIASSDSGDDKSSLDKIFGKLSLGDPISRNQGMSKLMGAAPIMTGDEFEDKKKVFGQLSELVPFRSQDRLMGGNVPSINIPIEERKKLMDYIAEIVGGNAVSNIQVQVPQAQVGRQGPQPPQPGPQQLYGPAQPGPQQLYGPAQPGPQQLYGPAQPGPQQPQLDTLLQRIKLLSVENFTNESSVFSTLLFAIVIVIVLVICIKMNF